MNLNIIPNGAIKRVHVSQNDVGRTLTFELFNNSTSYEVPSGATVKIQGTKPSGFGFSETCTVSGNTVTIDTTEAMTDEYGYIETELQISYSGNVLGTSNFILAVEKNPHPSNTTDGTQITAQSLEVRIEALEESALGGLTDEAKQALLNCFAHVAWIDEDGQDYYDALEDALYPPVTAISISPTTLTLSAIGATSQLTATTTPSGGNVTWTSSNTSVATVSSSGLVTSVGYGSCTITATSGSVSASCSVAIVEATVTSITATYTQSGTVYDTDSLDVLEDDLVVIAYFDNDTSQTVTSYTLSGTLTVGTSTITVTYGGKTTTFTVTVTHKVDNYLTADEAEAVFEGYYLNISKTYNFYQLTSNANQTAWVVHLPSAGTYRLSCYCTSQYTNPGMAATNMNSIAGNANTDILCISETNMDDATTSRTTNTTFQYPTVVSAKTEQTITEGTYAGTYRKYIDITYGSGGYIAISGNVTQGTWVLEDA